MKKTLTSLMILLLCIAASAQESEVYFTSDPTLTPDGNTIIFSYQGDLWKVPTAGGQADRITAMDGDETRPQVSPDGKWLAFTGTQFGNSDIYIIPMGGGDVKQLTYHEAFDHVDSWSWDSQQIYFTSNRYNRFSGYSVSISGDTPKRLFGHYFNTVHNVVPHPSSGEIFFNESWESKNFAHRKRYKGDYNPDVKSYNPTSGAFTKYTTYRGKDFGVTIDQNGAIYFKSDEANGEYNLYALENGQKKQLTTFDESIMWPRVSANGQKIVFRKGYQIHVYDVASGQTTKPSISIYTNKNLGRDQDFKTSGNITFFDVSPDNKKLAFVSRGELFISDVKGKFVKKLNTDSQEAVGEVRWLKDNKTLLFSQTIKGYYNWYKMSADGSGAAIRLTNDSQNNRLMSFNSDRSKGVYFSGRNEVRLMNLSNNTSETIVEEELWGFYNPYAYFSPDDRYIAFNARRDFEQDVFIYDTQTKQTSNLTNTKVSENSPYWSLDGKYLFVSSDRLNPGYPYGTPNTKILRIALDKYDTPFKSDKTAELFKEEEKEDDDDGKKKKKGKEDDEPAEDKMSVTINYDEIIQRMEAISPGFGQQFQPQVIQKDEKTIVIYVSDHDKGTSKLWKTTFEPFEDPKTEKVSDDRIGGYQIVEADGKYYLGARGNIYTLNGDVSKLDKVDISHTFRKNLTDEFTQIFYEAWAGMEENFYNETFHGQDWQGLRDRYGAYLPYVTRRADLRLIQNDMLGELNTSHFGFYSNGDEEDTYYGSQTVSTGLLFSDDDPYVVSRVVKDSPADVKGKDVRPGDRLVAINGENVDNNRNRESYFSKPSLDEEVTLTLERAGSRRDVKFHTQRYFATRNLLYDEWQDENQQYVDEKAGKRIAYIHMKNMGRFEFNQFKRDMVAEGGYRDGLILDLRYNTGGNVHDDVLRLLSQRPYLNWKYREGALTQQSNFGPAAKPIILLINEQSLSDAEMTAAGFKELGLGTIVGTETYRWIIFTTGNGLVDGSFYRLPSWGCYTLDGKNLEREGVAPDVRTDKGFKERLDGDHPQLDKAIELIMAELDK